MKWTWGKSEVKFHIQVSSKIKVDKVLWSPVFMEVRCFVTQRLYFEAKLSKKRTFPFSDFHGDRTPLKLEKMDISTEAVEE